MGASWFGVPEFVFLKPIRQVPGNGAYTLRWAPVDAQKGG